MKNYNFYVYILSSGKNGTLYIGFTNNLGKRLEEHAKGYIKGFTKKYGVYKLVYYEHFKYVNDAIYREKQLKKWNRKWKLELIEKVNPNWNELTD